MASTSTWDAQTKIPQRTTHAEAFDINGMFDEVDLHQAYTRLAAFITASYPKRHNRHISTHNRTTTGTWVKSTTNPKHHYTCQQALGLLKHILFEDYAQAGDTIYHSLSGIPMGGVASTAIANLLAASIELALFPHAKALFPDFFYIRFVDDVLCNLRPNQFQAFFGAHFKQIGMTFLLPLTQHNPSGNQRCDAITTYKPHYNTPELRSFTKSSPFASFRSHL